MTGRQIRQLAVASLIPAGLAGAVIAAGNPAVGAGQGEHRHAAAVREAAPAHSETAKTTFSTFQGNARHSGHMPDQLRFPLHQAWSVKLPGTPSYAVIDANRVVAMAVDAKTNATQMYGYNLTGRRVWGPIDVGQGLLGPALEGGSVFIATRDGLVASYSAATGRVIWVTQIPDQFDISTQPVALHGDIYVVGSEEGGTMFGFRQRDGKLTTSFKSDGGDVPVTADRTDEYVLQSGGNIDDIKRKSGAWRDIALEGSSETPPQLSGHQLWSLGDTTAQWANVTGSPGGATVPATQAAALWTHHARTLAYVVNDTSLTERSGAKSHARWTTTTHSPIVYPPLSVGDDVFVATRSGKIEGVDGTTGSVIWHRRIAHISWPAGGANRWNDYGSPLGLAEADHLLVVPGTNSITAFAHAHHSRR